jgi:predicted aspartyl protease
VRTICSIAVVIALFSEAWCAPAAESPQDVLAGHGLREEGGRWILSEERRLTRLFARFDEALREYYSTGKAWRQQIQQVDAVEAELAALNEKYQEIDGQRQRAANPLLQQQLEHQQGIVSQRLGELQLALKKLQSASDSPLYDAARQHAQARSDLAAIAAAQQGTRNRLLTQYETLARLADVELALAEIRASTDQDLRLGLSEAIGESFESASSRAAKALADAELPLVTSGKHVQLVAMLNERPITFLIDEDQPHTLLPLSQSERLGLAATSPAPGHELEWEQLPFGEQELRAARVQVDTLQIGDAMLRGVAIFVAAGEHADLGPRLGIELIDRLALRVDRGHARITVGREPSADQDATE